MKYAALVSYLGTRYYGFEKQTKHDTIQGHLERALSFMANKPIKVHGSGRTDKGVHAFGQVISFEYLEIKDRTVFIGVFNRLLPGDIAIKEVVSVPSSFDARHSSIGKKYVYAFSCGEKNPFDLLEYQFNYPKFDESLFNEALLLYEGKHDFRNFTTKKDDIDGFIRTLERPILTCTSNAHYEVSFTGNGFMRYMVRILVGAAFRVSFKKMGLKSLRKALDDINPRHILSMKADPSGLRLEEVYYDIPLFGKKKGEQAR